MKRKSAIILAALVLYGCAGSGSRSVVNRESVAVKVMHISEASDTQVRSYVGEAVAASSVVLSAPYPGTLQKLNIKSGTTVSNNKVVAEIVSESVLSSYEIAHATLKQAEDGYERAKMVYQKGGLSEVKFVEIETALAKAKASASAAEDALEACKVRAPYSGMVSEVYVQKGVKLAIAQPIAKIIDASSLEVVFAVPETELPKIDKGQLATVDIPALDLFNISAEVVRKGFEANALSHTYQCALKLGEKVKGFAPGMICKIRLSGDTQTGNIIPAHIVQTDVHGRYVWTVSDGQVNKTRISTGGFSPRGIIVDEGLSAGDMVIIEGFQKVSTGMSVKVIE